MTTTEKRNKGLAELGAYLGKTLEDIKKKPNRGKWVLTLTEEEAITLQNVYQMGLNELEKVKPEAMVLTRELSIKLQQLFNK